MVLIALVCALGDAAARIEPSAEAAGEPAQTFRARTDLVELDVSVLDVNRRPIKGLTKEEFTVLEDGKPQEVAFFEAIESVPPDAPARSCAVAKDGDTPGKSGCVHAARKELSVPPKLRASV